MGRGDGGAPPDRHSTAADGATHSSTDTGRTSVQRASDQFIAPWDAGAADAGDSAFATMNSARSGGYRFDPGTVAALISRWENVLHDLQDDQQTQESALTAAQPPSPDQPAVQQAQLAQASIRKMIAHNVSMQRSAYAYINALKKANGTYTQHDADVAEALGKANPSSSPSSGMYQ